MTNILQFPDVGDDREQAALWIVRLERGLRAGEREQLQRWLMESGQHRTWLLDLAATWDKSTLLREIAPLFPRSGAVPGPGRWRLAATAMVCLVVGLAVSLVWRELRTGPVEPPPMAMAASTPAATEYTSAFGQRRLIALADGSRITLNTDSRVRVQLTQRSRELELLQGQALFEVARDPQRVFRVTAGASRFEAVGTAFDLRLDPMAGVQLTVTEGRVRVVAPPANRASGVTDPELVVDAGRSVTVGVGKQDIEAPKRVQPEVVTAWTRGMIVFDAVPLGDAVREISRYSRLRFRINNNEINQLPVSGYFRAGDTDALVESLKSNFNVESRREGDEIVLWAADDR